MLFRFAVPIVILLASCGEAEPARSLASQAPLGLPTPVTSLAGEPAATAAPAAASDSIAIRFEQLTDEGLTLSVSVVGDADGETVFSNQGCCGIGDARIFISDVRARSGAAPVPAEAGPTGWIARHAPSAPLTVTYRLPPSGAMTIDTGALDQLKPIVDDGIFHLIGSMALLLPRGRAEADLVELSLDATRFAGPEGFVSSFGPGNRLRGLVVPRSQVTRALYLGGAISLDVLETPTGRVGVAHSAMGEAFMADEMRGDVLAIVGAARRFFRDGQAWYLVSLHGGKHTRPEINVGGGTGLTDSFAMFARSDLDLSNHEHREHFRWVLAHEYFHEWNGLTLRVAPLGGTKKDDAATYWFSEGVTDFYTMRLLTRAGLQSPARSRDVLNHKLARYATNGKRDLGASEAGSLFWSDPEAEQVPYLRGYLAAWYIELELRRASDASLSLDALMLALVDRARREPDFRIDNRYLLDHFGDRLSADAASRLRGLIVDGGAAPFDPDSFEPCLGSLRKTVSGSRVLQFDFADPANQGCFRH